MTGRIAIPVLALLPFFSQAVLAQDAETRGKGVNQYSREKEAALGAQLAAETRRRTTPMESATVQSYLDGLGQRLAAHMPQASIPFSFSLIAEDPCSTVHEPIGLPGGYIFVPAALFLAVQDEAEFAGMLAHSMEHIAQRQGARPAARGQISNAASVPLIFLGGWSGSCGGSSAIPAGFVTIQRRDELEADALAAQTMEQAGFDPRALMRYIGRVQPGPSPGASAASSPIPPRDERVATLMSMIAKLPTATYPVPADGAFAAAREEVRRLVASDRPTPPSLRH